MAKQTVAGISGVLGGLISAAPPEVPARETTPKAPPTVVGHGNIEATKLSRPGVNSSPIRATRSKATARRGRPPGRATGASPAKAKVTLRVDARLMDDYREWSWAQRCQLGELVERALANYRRMRA